MLIIICRPRLASSTLPISAGGNYFSIYRSRHIYFIENISQIFYYYMCVHVVITGNVICWKIIIKPIRNCMWRGNCVKSKSFRCKLVKIYQKVVQICSSSLSPPPLYWLFSWNVVRVTTCHRFYQLGWPFVHTYVCPDVRIYQDWL